MAERRAFNLDKARMVEGGEVVNPDFNSREIQGRIFRDLTSLAEWMKGTDVDDYRALFGDLEPEILRRYRNFGQHMADNLERLLKEKESR